MNIIGKLLGEDSIVLEENLEDKGNVVENTDDNEKEAPPKPTPKKGKNNRNKKDSKSNGF
jgi:hypothetical protein